MVFNYYWDELLLDELNKPYFKSLMAFLSREYATKKIYPEKDNVFTAFHLTDYSQVRVVILGQDPYFHYHQAHGLAFSVFADSKMPPSLINIYKEIEADLGVKMSNNGNLTKWAMQGVFLLNTVLTVEENKPGSHRGLGWEQFTDEVISLLNDRESPIVFMLWGNDAMKKLNLITNPSHVVLTAPHPSPLSAFHGFFGCKHFSQANNYLTLWGQMPIDWQN
jgi:uracil-DNA glycosylase